MLSMVNCVVWEFNLNKAILYENNNHNGKMVRWVMREASGIEMEQPRPRWAKRSWGNKPKELMSEAGRQGWECVCSLGVSGRPACMSRLERAFRPIMQIDFCTLGSP